MITHPVLHRLAGHGMRLGLDRVEAFLDHLGRPHRSYPVLHVAGTNGKGSVSTMLTEALVASGRCVGTNTSPHLQDVNERIRIDGVPLDDAALASVFDHLDVRRLAWARREGLGDDALTYFEFVTVAAMAAFADRRVDAAVFEVGLGGRLDATNVVQPTVCAITSIGLDHTDRLGHTLAAVAGEKAGILKPGVPAVVGPMAPEALTAIEARAGSLGVPLWRAGHELRMEHGEDGVRIHTPAGSLGGLRLAMPGAHQVENALVAVGVLHALRGTPLEVSDEHIILGLVRAVVPGRIEQLAPGLVVDGSHNVAGTTALAAWLASCPRPAHRTLLFGMGVDRDPGAVIAPLLGQVDEVVTTSCAHPKARTAEALALALGELSVPVRSGGPIEVALPDAVARGQVVVAGSLFLAGAVRSLVHAGALGTAA